MSEETQAAPVAEAQNTATEPTSQTPEVVTPETTAEPEQASEQDERDKAIKRMERRINRKHAEAAEAKAERDWLKQRLEQYEAQRAPEEKQEVDPRDFERAVTQRAQEVAEAREFDRQCNEVAAKGAKKFPDFQDAVNTLTSELPLFDSKGAPTPAMRVVLEADNPPALLHYLGKNPDLASELADLTPTQLSRRLDRIEREMATPKTSNAPKPLEPVKAAASESGLSAAKSDQEWAALRDKDLQARRVRI
jgi:hypothetical protein